MKGVTSLHTKQVIEAFLQSIIGMMERRDEVKQVRI